MKRTTKIFSTAASTLFILVAMCGIALAQGAGGEEAANEIDVRLAIQPRWAFEHSIGDIELVNMNEPDEDDEDEPESEEPKYVLYIAEGGQLGYLPGVASNTLGFGR